MRPVRNSQKVHRSSTAGMRCQLLRTARITKAQQSRATASSGRVCRMHAAPSGVVEASKEFDAKKFLRPHLLELAPYTPIEPFEVLFILISLCIT